MKFWQRFVNKILLGMPTKAEVKIFCTLQHIPSHVSSSAVIRMCFLQLEEKTDCSLDAKKESQFFFLL
jgi:hypothetical protein